MSTNKNLEAIYAGYADEPDLADLIKEYALRKPALIHGHGQIPPEAIIVGEAPGAQEVMEGRPFVGPSGQFLRRVLVQAGINPDALWITNAVKFRPRKNRTPDRHEVMASRPYLMQEIAFVSQSALKPLRVLACGKTAALAILGQPVSVTSEMGTVYVDRNKPFAPQVMICWHPSAALRGADARREFPEVIKSFANLMNGQFPDAKE